MNAVFVFCNGICYLYFCIFHYSLDCGSLAHQTEGCTSCMHSHHMLCNCLHTHMHIRAQAGVFSTRDYHPGRGRSVGRCYRYSRLELPRLPSAAEIAVLEGADRQIASLRQTASETGRGRLCSGHSCNVQYRHMSKFPGGESSLISQFRPGLLVACFLVVHHICYYTRCVLSAVYCICLLML